ncbi:peptidoglycan editing factor PgeF [Evansella sp. LMS18]|uniref:peptidoglycan editing factor PgeF n=1 Tax=Evansella sp. LMS18 TaxID=2924033 RepID=UPI0020D0B6D9|nr:peptidoglycan editing factor PgeF [Evansella sp. LMS18]UTR09161.1 peptidoglycan editing factor PgeF [Evansella sp. LMS18]
MSRSDDIFKQESDQLLTLNSLQEAPPGLIAGFTTKKGGTSEEPFTSFNLGLHVKDLHSSVMDNRKKLSELLNFSLSSWVCAEQVHGSKIAKVEKEHAGLGTEEYKDGIKETDGLYTKETDILLTLCYADCVPLFFYDNESGLVGAAHAGWKGTVKDIAGEMVRTWEKDEGVKRERIHAVIGPSIGSCCYVVDDYVIGYVDKALHTNSSKPYKQISDGQYSLDLKELNKKLLLQAGVKEENIKVSGLCTSCNEELFFSHRRDMGQTGRMLSFIGRKS